MSKKKPQAQAKITQETTVAEVLHADLALIRSDLLKTVGITLLLLVGIFGIFIYLR
jgi:hypothetical protein